MWIRVCLNEAVLKISKGDVVLWIGDSVPSAGAAPAQKVFGLLRNPNYTSSRNSSSMKPPVSGHSCCMAAMGE